MKAAVKDNGKKDWSTEICEYVLYTEHTVGWVDFDQQIILDKSTPGIYSFLCKSTDNRRNKFWSHYWLAKRLQ
jgi:hypothetical protein